MAIDKKVKELDWKALIGVDGPQLCSFTNEDRQYAIEHPYYWGGVRFATGRIQTDEEIEETRYGISEFALAPEKKRSYVPDFISSAYLTSKSFLNMMKWKLRWKYRIGL